MATGVLTNPQNFPPYTGFQLYTPALTGATNDPVATYTTQFGKFAIIGPLVFFKFVLVTSTMTKSTLTDALRITLPLVSATNTGDVTVFKARVENATAVANALQGEIASNTAYATFRNYAALATAGVQTTYAATDPGIGVLTNTITFQGSGFYEY
ncbi:MAG TPA: hypothetical protein PLK61_04060 [Nitrosomonas sp.]|nr:hypothetical protein [Nitrosomonas sp.]